MGAWEESVIQWLLRGGKQGAIKPDFAGVVIHLVFIARPLWNLNDHFYFHGLQSREGGDAGENAFSNMPCTSCWKATVGISNSASVSRSVMIEPIEYV